MSSAQTSMIVNATSFDATTHVGYSKPKVNASGGKSVNIVNPNTQQILNISTPLVLTWGVSEYVDDKSGKRSYEMALQFPKAEYATPATEKFLAGMKAMENKIKNDALANSKEWFNKQKMSAEVIDALFHPMLRYPKDQNTGEADLERSPTLKVKLNYWDGAFDNTEIYDMDQQMLFGPGKQEPGKGPIELIPKATNVAVVMRCGGLWFANGKFGCTWRLVQVVVKPRATLAGKCHIQLGDDERERLAAQADENDESSSPAVMTAVVDSEDDEVPQTPVAEALLQDAEPPWAPQKVVKRKVVRKTKPTE
mgnify:CR=1 FL=1